MSMWSLDLFYAMVDSVSVRFKNARVESASSVRFKNARVSQNAFKHSYTVECGNRLRVGVRATLAQRAPGVKKIHLERQNQAFNTE